MLESLADFFEEAAEPDFATFCAEPLLIIRPFEPDDETGFETLKGSDHSPALRASVARVKKRPGANAFTMMITIGRAPNNDVQLKAKGVSKFHGYLRQDAGRWTITDAGSTFGTHVGGTELRPRDEHRPLATGDEVRIGSGVHAVFVAAPDAQRFLLDAAASGSFQPVRR